MKKQNKLILWAAIILLGGGIAFWVRQESTRSSSRAAGLGSKQTSAVPTTTLKQGSLSPAATSAGGVNAPGVATRSSRQFVNMNILEQEAIMNEVRKQDLASIFRMWIEAGRVDHDLMKQSAIGSVLAYVMRERMPGAELLGQFSAFISDNSNSVYERGQLLRALSQAGTKESLDLLIQAATAPPSEEIRQVAIGQILSVGGLRGDGTFHEELAPALERVWHESKDTNLLASVAVAMARIGAPSSIELLISSALDSTSQRNSQALLAQRALPEVLNPDAVTTLSTLLVNQPPTSAVSKLASSTLANMVDATSASALVNWLQNADSSAAPLAHDSVLLTRAPAHLAAWESALIPAVPFRSEKNREAIRTGLAEYRKNHGG